MAFLASLTPREQQLLTDDQQAWLARVPAGEAPTVEQSFADGWCLGYLHSTVEPANKLPGEVD